jgi:hypothetical protein
LEIASLLTIKDAETATALELIVRFVGGGNRYSEIARELSLSGLTCALGNIVSNHVDRSKEMRAETSLHFPARLSSSLSRLASRVCVVWRLPSFTAAP